MKDETLTFGPDGDENGRGGGNMIIPGRMALKVDWDCEGGEKGEAKSV